MRLTTHSPAMSVIAAVAAAFMLIHAEGVGDDEERVRTSREFLNVTRHPPGRECWASMEGEISHRRKGKSTVSAPLYVGLRFTPEMTLAQVLIDDDESYMIGQRYRAGEDAISVIPDVAEGKTPRLGVFGLRPEDLAMSFLFWNFIEETRRDSIRGRECRVFILESPDGDGRRVRVHVSAEYFFPLKVEWLAKDDPDGGPLRTLEIDSFEKEGDFWLVSDLRAYGPDWRTAIEFSECDAAYTNEKRPEKLFRQVKEKSADGGEAR